MHVTKSAYIRHIAPNVNSADILEVSVVAYDVRSLPDGNVALYRSANSTLGTCGWQWMDQILKRSKMTTSHRFCAVMDEL